MSKTLTAGEVIWEALEFSDWEDGFCYGVGEYVLAHSKPLPVLTKYKNIVLEASCDEKDKFDVYHTSHAEIVPRVNSMSVKDKIALLLRVKECEYDGVTIADLQWLGNMIDNTLESLK